MTVFTRSRAYYLKTRTNRSSNSEAGCNLYALYVYENINIEEFKKGRGNKV